jgi:hypothetical protein
MNFYLLNRRAFFISAVLFFGFVCFIKVEAQIWQNYKKAEFDGSRFAFRLEEFCFKLARIIFLTTRTIF